MSTFIASIVFVFTAPMAVVGFLSTTPEIGLLFVFISAALWTLAEMLHESGK